MTHIDDRCKVMEKESAEFEDLFCLLGVNILYRFPVLQSSEFSKVMYLRRMRRFRKKNAARMDPGVQW